MAKQQPTMYSVWFLTKDSHPRAPSRTPFATDSYRGILSHRNEFFVVTPAAVKCWIVRSRDDQVMGKVLVR